MLRLAAIVFLVSGSLGHSSVAPTEPGWELVRRDSDMTLYERSVPGSDVVAFKGEGFLDAPLDRVASVLLDDHRAPEWVERLKEARVLRILSPEEYVEYDHITTPFVMKDREFVTQVRIQVSKSDRSMTLVYHSVEDPSAPRTDFVRGELMSSSFFLAAVEGGARTRLLAEIHADPKGSVPKWIVNFFQKSWPRDTFHGIQSQLKKTDLGVPEQFAPVVAKLHAVLDSGQGHP